MSRIRLACLATALLAALFGCGKDPSPSAKPVRVLRIATTTSVADSGLLGDLIPRFENWQGQLAGGRDVKVEYIAVGSGQAIKLAESGEADLLMVHSPKDEEAFVAKGNAPERRPFAFNDFVIVGPPEDPAGVRGMANAARALPQILEKGQEFYSRGDKSGTNRREQDLWKAAGVDPAGRPGYLEAGAGMAITLNIAWQKRAYTLVDRGTWLALMAKQKMDLEVLVEGDPSLLNVYSLLCVKPSLRPGGQPEAARAFADWILSTEGQAAIAAYRPGGQPSKLALPALFRPISELPGR